MKKVILFGLAVVLFVATSTVAADKVVVIPLHTSQTNNPGWINLNPSSATFGQGAFISIQVGKYAGITLPDADSPSFGLGFTIPPDFQTGSDLTIHMLWNISATGCNVNFQPLALSVARPGRPHLTGSSVSTGITITGGNILNASTIVDQPQETLITITSPEDGTDLEGGDSIILGFMRWPWHPDDTCVGSSMKIPSLYVTYPKN